MKKAIIILACIAVLCVSITTCLRTPAPMQVSAARNSSLPSILSTISVDMPLAFMGSPNSTEPQGLTPTDVKAIYNLPSTGGNGTIAIIDPYDVPTIKNDLQSFSAKFNLPFNESQFRKVTVDVPQGQTISSNINATVETVMDVEWAHAIAPKAPILLVETYNNSLGCQLDGVLYAESQQNVTSISMSWGINETLLEQVLENNGFTESDLDPYYFTDSYNASFFAASGDTATPMLYPACSPNVVAVGGTTLNFYSNDSLSSETVWNNGYGTTGGGISAFETEPSYQASYGVPNSNGHRCVPDVSFDADPVSGVAIYCTSPTPYGTNWLPAGGGTSLGAPCWAAINSLNRTTSNPRLYAIGKSVYNSASYRDITEGNNGNYAATTGYDFCTGLGSPITSAFVSLLLGDANLDGTTNILDAILVSNAYNTKNGDSRFNPYADFNGDLKVNTLDAIILSSNYMEKYTAGQGALKQLLSGGALIEGGASVAANPSQATVFKDEVFTVNVDLTSVTDLLGWQFTLYWNSTVLNCTNYVSPDTH